MNSAARTMAVLAGVGLLVVGGVAISQAGFPDGTTPPHVEVDIGVTVHRTAMTAVVEVVIGVLLVLSGVVTRDGRGILLTSLAVLGAGVVLLIAPGIAHDWVGSHRTTGVAYTVIGLVGAGAANLSLATAHRRRRMDRAAGVR